MKNYINTHKMTSKDSAPESEEQRYRLKCKELKRRIEEVNESNELATLAINRTKTSIRRMRIEYSILLERLESNAVKFPEFGEEMSPPPSPSFDVSEKPKTSNKKQKKSAPIPIKSRIRDPNLPKRPTNAYLIFCESEKDRIKRETGDSTLSTISDLGKSLVEKWKALDEEGKKPYHKLYDEDKARYKREMAAYSSSQVGKDDDIQPSSTGLPSTSDKISSTISSAEGDIKSNGDEDNDNDDNDNIEEEDGDEEDESRMDIEPASEMQSELPSELHSEPPSELASEPASDTPFENDEK